MGLIRRKARKREMLEFSLNVNSLMDVLTVLLFFLMKSFSVSSNTLETPDGIHLPGSVVKSEIEESVTVALSDKSLRANNKVLLTLDKGRFLASDFTPDHQALAPLKDYLDLQMKKRNHVYQAAAAASGQRAEMPPGKILIQSDKDLPFLTVKHLLQTAAVSGYNDYEFIVMNPED